MGSKLSNPSDLPLPMAGKIADFSLEIPFLCETFVKYPVRFGQDIRPVYPFDKFAIVRITSA
jgi:hypothetical protein